MNKYEILSLQKREKKKRVNSVGEQRGWGFGNVKQSNEWVKERANQPKRDGVDAFSGFILFPLPNCIIKGKRKKENWK